VECGLVGDGEFVGSHGQAAPLFEAVDAAFDGIPLFVGLGVEAGWPASKTTAPPTVANLVGRLRNDSADAAAAEMPADRTG
jgi:hypothetical protein